MAWNILIVDDSPAMRRVVRRVIDLAGLDLGLILEAGDGREALATLGHEWIDLIITDINMPNMNGEELLVALRVDPTLTAIPVLVLSTDASDTRVARMLAQGASGYLPKPFQPCDLFDQLTRLLGEPADATV